MNILYNIALQPILLGSLLTRLKHSETLPTAGKKLHIATILWV